ncbi:MAG: response regulator transcription factor [Bacteroidota bacterium]
MRCIIIEDQPPAQRILQKYIQDTGTLVLEGTFTNALQAMEYLKKNKVDLIFLDIHLPKLSGFSFLKVLPNPPAVILTTAFSEYALESYEFNVLDYLLKPFSFQRFLQAVAKVPLEQEKSGRETREIFVKSGHEHIKISLEDVLMIKSDRDYTEIYLPTGRHLSRKSLRYWLETLAPQLFFQVHKSYLVNIHKIERISANQVYLVGDKTAPIGRAYKDEFYKKFVR